MRDEIEVQETQGIEVSRLINTDHRTTNSPINESDTT